MSEYDKYGLYGGSYEKGKAREERDRRRDMEPDYEDIPFDKYKTENMRKEHQEYYPRQSDSNQFKKYLETERSLVSKPLSRREENESAREYVSQDNKNAHRDRRDAGIATRDMAYPRDHPLHEGYKTYKTKRDTPREGKGSSSKDLPRR